VLVDDDTATASDACEPIVNASEVSGKIALVQRGECTFEIKLGHAEDAGAIAVVVYNIAGDPIVMNGTAGSANIPAVMIGQADGNLILAELDRAADVSVLLDKSLFLTESDSGNAMASFSSRGPGPVLDILKPDVTAPGVNILAGFTPDASNATKGENFAYLSGTSMSTPHVAGVAALLLEANPDWSPSALKSALMTTARRDITLADGETSAGPFDFGAGHDQSGFCRCENRDVGDGRRVDGRRRCQRRRAFFASGAARHLQPFVGRCFDCRRLGCAGEYHRRRRFDAA